MSSYAIKNEQNYMRLLDSDGTALSHTGGVLDVGASFSGDVTSGTASNFLANVNIHDSAGSAITLGQQASADSISVIASSTGFNVAVTSSALPTDASSETTLSAMSAKLPASLGQKAQNASLSVCQNSSGDWNCGVNSVPVAGAHANASNAVTTAGANENSTAIDCQYVSTVVAFGSVSQACSVKLFQSQDNSNFYDTGASYTASGAGDFNISLPDAGARYYRLQYSASGTTVTATIAGKN